MRIITGFHAIEELLRSGAGTSEGAKAHILYAKPGPRTKKILEDAKKRGIHARSVPKAELDALTVNLAETARGHRGIVLIIEGGRDSEQNIVNFDEFVSERRQRSLLDAREGTLGQSGNSIVVIMDSITDPHNVGAILRSCDQFGVDLVIIPDRNTIKSGEVVLRASAGASAWVPLSIVPNATRAVEQLKKAGYWIFAADAAGTSVGELALAGNIAVVLGSEGSGVSRLLKENCDGTVSIPTQGKLDSLNVSVAAGILLYEINRQFSKTLPGLKHIQLL